MNYYHLLTYFLLYSFLGWVLEVAYHVLKQGKIINRGFLNGPVCPIYGVGMVGVIVALDRFAQAGNLVLLFVGGTIFATLVELIGGFVLYKVFHMRWWDYSNEPFNLGGYICLRFSIAWGICIVFAVEVVHPLINVDADILSGFIGHILVALACLIYFVDFVCTVLAIMNLNKDLKHLNALAKDMRSFSDNLTEKIGETTFAADARVQEGRLQAALGKAEARDRFQEEMKKLSKYRTLHSLFGYRRLAKAFPDLKHDLYDEALGMVRKKLAENK